jgi:hypothetical protein
MPRALGRRGSLAAPKTPYEYCELPVSALCTPKPGSRTTFYMR